VWGGGKFVNGKWENGYAREWGGGSLGIAEGDPWGCVVEETIDEDGEDDIEELEGGDGKVLVSTGGVESGDIVRPYKLMCLFTEDGLGPLSCCTAGEKRK